MSTKKVKAIFPNLVTVLNQVEKKDAMNGSLNGQELHI